MLDTRLELGEKDTIITITKSQAPLKKRSSSGITLLPYKHDSRGHSVCYLFKNKQPISTLEIYLSFESENIIKKVLYTCL